MKIFSVLAEFELWELSIVSSLSLYSILVQHAYNDRAWLTSEYSRVAAPLDYHKYFHLDTFVKSEIITAQLGKASGESGFRSFRKA